MFGFLLHNKNMAPLVNFKLTSVTLTQINTKPAQLISSRVPAYKEKKKTKKKQEILFYVLVGVNVIVCL